MGHIGGKSSRFLAVLVVFVLLGLVPLPRTATAQSIAAAPALQTGVAGVAGATADHPSATGPAGVSGSTLGASIRVPKGTAATTNGAGIAQASSHERPADVASTDDPVLKGLEGGIQATVRKLSPTMTRALEGFQNASASFPSFCRDWERKLRDRERNNLAHIDWRMLGGVETGNYVGYSTVDSCLCKQASNGVPIGELTYKEFEYVLTGKSVDDAKRSAPKATSIVPTREIFSWDKDKWYY